MSVTIEQMVERWAGAERPLFKGKLIDDDGCYCAQGDVLHCAGISDEAMRRMEQSKADAETAKLLGISRSHAVLLRIVNDQEDGAPQIVLTHPEKILGPQAPLILAFWKRLDAMTPEQWDAARGAAWDAAWASNEIQGAEILERDGREPYFLKVFGIDTWEMLRNLK